MLVSKFTASATRDLRRLRYFIVEHDPAVVFTPRIASTATLALNAEL